MSEIPRSYGWVLRDCHFKQSGGSSWYTWDQLTPGERRDYEEQARAVIRAFVVRVKSMQREIEHGEIQEHEDVALCMAFEQLAKEVES